MVDNLFEGINSRIRYVIRKHYFRDTISSMDGLQKQLKDIKAGGYVFQTDDVLTSDQLRLEIKMLEGA